MSNNFLCRISVATLLGFIICLPSYGRVVGVKTKSGLLRQIEIALDIKLKDYVLPTPLIDRLPADTNIDYIDIAFVTAWTQLTFRICLQAISKGQIPQFANDSQLKQWLSKIAENSWACEATDVEVNESFHSGFNPELVNISRATRVAMTCGHILSSPRVYSVLEEK